MWSDTLYRFMRFVSRFDMRVLLIVTYLFVLGMFSLFILYPDVIIYLVFRALVHHIFG
jgi:hypothetical protein